MAKTAAERQKEYRERRKRNDPDYLKQERERAKKYRKPIGTLSVKEQNIRRRRNNFYALTFREKAKKEKQKDVNITVQYQERTIANTTETADPNASDKAISNPRSTRSSNEPILVKMLFPEKKRENNKLKVAREKIKTLERSVAVLERNKSKWKKKYQRTLSKLSRADQNSKFDSNEDRDDTGDMELTPRSRTNSELKKLRASPNTKIRVKKKLLLTNVLIEEVRSAKAKNNDSRKQRILSKIVSGNILKKYRCKTTLKIQTGIGVPRRDSSKSVVVQQRIRVQNQRIELKKRVVDFLIRDDVSTQLPGKKDVTKHNKENYQTRVLSDYLVNIYEKFLSENPMSKISFSYFCKIRPAYVKLTSCISRNTCLCTKHQNISMKLKCLRSSGVTVTQNAESAGKHVSIEEMKLLLEQLSDEKPVEFTEWKRVEEGGKKRMRIVKVKKSKLEFTEIMSNEYEQFLKHVNRVKLQYIALRELKLNLPPEDLVVQMDFAENFTCSAMDEIQSAYFNASTVTLHPIVLYFKNQKLELDHKNFIYVSDVNHHNATAVLTILDKLMADIHYMFPAANTIHFWTDSPSSQYRNKYIFKALVKFGQMHGVNGRWNYFEAGHGKGPCDGLGGVAKRQAAEAIKQGKACIQDAKDFFTWAIANQKSIQYRFYSNEEYEITSNRIMQNPIKPIPGTMKLHAVLVDNEQMFTAETSCYCPGCLQGLEGTLCESWTKVLRVNTNIDLEANNDQESVNIQTDTDNPDLTNPITTDQQLQIKDLEEGMFIAALYERKWYIGQIIDIDLDDSTIHTKFMKEAKTKQTSLFQWPAKEDTLWINLDDVLCKIEEPIGTGKRLRLFKLLPTDLELIEAIYSNKS